MDSDTIDENSPPILCSKPGCKRLAGARYKRCDPCRNRQATTVQKGRSKRKTAEAVGTTDVPKERKRARKEDPSEDERPTQRARSRSPDSVPENLHTTSDNDDDDEDGIPFLDLDKKVSYLYDGTIT